MKAEPNAMLSELDSGKGVTMRSFSSPDFVRLIAVYFVVSSQIVTSESGVFFFINRRIILFFRMS